MIQSIFTLFALLMLGACIGVAVIIAVLYCSWDKD
jgi:hypothetical protein